MFSLDFSEIFKNNRFLTIWIAFFLKLDLVGYEKKEKYSVCISGNQKSYNKEELYRKKENNGISGKIAKWNVSVADMQITYRA